MHSAKQLKYKHYIQKPAHCNKETKRTHSHVYDNLAHTLFPQQLTLCPPLVLDVFYL